MRYRTFVSYNIIGGLGWAAGITTLGYYLGKLGFINHNIEFAAIALVVISLAPIAIDYLRHRHQSTG